MIISAGYRIGPFEVESACIEHPAVRRSGRRRLTRRGKGNVVKAFIVLAAGHEPPTSSQGDPGVSSADHLSAYAYPRKIEFVDELPKTLTGKIRRIELREAEREHSS